MNRVGIAIPDIPKGDPAYGLNAAKYIYKHNNDFYNSDGCGLNVKIEAKLTEDEILSRSFIRPTNGMNSMIIKWKIKLNEN